MRKCARNFAQDSNESIKRSKYNHSIEIYNSNDFQHDFTDLATFYPPFAQQLKQLKSRRKIDIQRSTKSNLRGGDLFSCFGTYVTFDFNVELTRAILLKDHGLVLPSMPNNRLCPPVPNRLNYVRWIKDLVLGNICNIASQEKRLHFQGMDIGTGSSCIYPLLLSSVFSKQSDKWRFFATEVDPISLKSAQSNVDANHLQDCITVALVKQTEDIFNVEAKKSAKLDSSTFQPSQCVYGPLQNSLLAALSIKKEKNTIESQQFDFCMTNPPFYATIAQCQTPRVGDFRDRTAMTLSESFYPRGGETAFITDIIHDSLQTRQQITWYTSLIGQKSTLHHVERILLDLGFGRGSIATAEFVQGGRGSQRRWGIAWTFMQVPMRNPACQYMGGFETFEVELCCTEKKETDASVSVIKSCGSPTTNIPLLNVDLKASTSLNAIVAHRVCDYCNFLEKRMSCNLQTRTKNCQDLLGPSIVTIFESKSPPEISKVSRQKNASLSPADGEFLIDVILHKISKEVEDRTGKSSEIRTCKDPTILVKLSCFSHTKRGDEIINQIKSQMIGEIQRTNRRWRRLLR